MKDSRTEEMPKTQLSQIKKLWKTETPKKYAFAFVCIFVLTLILELGLFNFKFWSSLFSHETHLSGLTDVAGISKSGSGYDVNGTVSIRDLDTEVKYIYIDLPDDGESSEQVNITVSAKDEANVSSALSSPSRTVVSDVKRTKYIRLNYLGKISELNISFSGGASLGRDGIVLNVHVPMMFSIVRFLFLLAVLMLLYVLRPRSFVYRYAADLKNQRQRLIAAAFAAVTIIIFIFSVLGTNKATLSWADAYQHHRQYYDLIEAFKNGHTYLDDEPSEALKSLENPYDKASRDRSGANALWDHAYYNGKYYVYFGAAPAVFLYLPYNLITGGDLPNYAAVIILGSLLIVGMMKLLWEIIKKKFKNTPFAVYLILSATLPYISGNAYAIYKPDFYLVPILSAVMLGVWGLSFWISAYDEKKREISAWRLCVGSAFIACIAGCRPQQLLVIAPGVIIYWKAVFSKDRLLFSRDTLRPTLALCLPMVIAAAVVMAYNAARFGSPFDFGANYNLTMNDMTHRGIVFGRNGLGLFSYFLQPFKIDAVFPFMHDFGASTVYQGLTLTENQIGGVLWVYPILILGVYGAFRKKLFADTPVCCRIVCASVIIAAALAMLDAQMAGLLTRYFNDFVWFMAIASAITIFAMYEEPIMKRRNINRMVLILCTVTMCLAFLSIFARTEDSVSGGNPTLYYGLQSLIAFWM